MTKVVVHASMPFEPTLPSSISSPDTFTGWTKYPVYRYDDNSEFLGCFNAQYENGQLVSYTRVEADIEGSGCCGKPHYLTYTTSQYSLQTRGDGSSSLGLSSQVESESRGGCCVSKGSTGDIPGGYLETGWGATPSSTTPTTVDHHAVIHASVTSSGSNELDKSLQQHSLTSSNQPLDQHTITPSTADSLSTGTIVGSSLAALVTMVPGLFRLGKDIKNAAFPEYAGKREAAFSNMKGGAVGTLTGASLGAALSVSGLCIAAFYVAGTTPNFSSPTSILSMTLLMLSFAAMGYLFGAGYMKSERKNALRQKTLTEDFPGQKGDGVPSRDLTIAMMKKKEKYQGADERDIGTVYDEKQKSLTAKPGAWFPSAETAVRGFVYQRLGLRTQSKEEQDAHTSIKHKRLQVA